MYVIEHSGKGGCDCYIRKKILMFLDSALEGEVEKVSDFCVIVVFRIVEIRVFKNDISRSSVSCRMLKA